jgi:large subunit ribosomal protein L10
MLTYAQKQEQVAELHDKLGRASSVIVADYRGLDVASVSALRAKLRTAGSCEYRVVKNSILRRASEGTGVASIAKHFKGPTAVALAFGDPVALAKVLVEFAKDNPALTVKGAVVAGTQMLDAAGVKALSTMPGLPELRAKLLGLLQAPATQLVRLLGTPATQTVRVLKAHQDKLEGK